MTTTLGILVRKELTEALRDRKVLFMVVVMPILIYPVIMGGMSYLSRQEEAKVQEAILKVAVTGEQVPFAQWIQEDEGLVLVADAPPDSLESMLRTKDENQVRLLQLWVDAPDGMAAMGASEIPTIRLVHDATDKDSREALKRVRSLFREKRSFERQRRYETVGGTDQLTNVLPFDEVDVATESEAAGAQAGRMLIYVLLMTLFMGGAAFANDIVAGEKERGTLETLFLIPAKRETIAHSKLVIVALGTAITGILSLCSLGMSYRMGWIEESGNVAALSLSPGAIVLTFLLVVPLAILIGGLLLAISSFARSLKEAQSYQLPAMFVIFVPALMSMSQSIELNPVIAVIPIANVAFAMRDVILGQIAWETQILVVVATLVWAALALRWVGAMMSREEMVLGFDPEPLLARTRGGRTRALHIGMACAILLYFYLGQLLQAKLLLRGLALSLWVLLPVLAAGVWLLARSAGPWRETLSLRAPRPHDALAGLLLGLGLMLPIAWAASQQGRFLPAPTSQMAGLEAMFNAARDWQLVVLMALSPAVFEELLFRGVCLGLMLKIAGRRQAVLMSSVYFGLMHLSVFRFLPTFSLGVVLAMLTVRSRSIVPAVLAHFAYNGTLLMGGRYAEQHGLPFDPTGIGAWVASLALVIAGILLLRTSSARDGSIPTHG
jgi:sodium transport system permease protein